MKWLVGSVALVAALVLAVAFLPLRLVVPRVVPDLAAEAISGSVWNGRLESAEWRGVALGNLNVALDARALVAGRLRLDFVRDGSGLRGRIGTAGGFHVLEALDGPLGLVLPFPFEPRLDIALTGAALRLDTAGSCLDASGGIAARLSGIPGIGTTPAMNGTLACDEGALFLPLTTSDGQLGMAVHLWADRRYRADLIVTSRSLAVRLALAAAGFTSGPDGSTLRIEGAF